MYYIMSDFNIQTVAIMKKINRLKVGSKLFLPRWTLRFEEERLSSGLSANEVVYYIDALRHGKKDFKQIVPDIPSEYTERKVTNQISEYLDENQVIRLKVIYFAGNLNTVKKFDMTGAPTYTDYYDSRGFLNSTSDVVEQIDTTFDFDGKPIFKTDHQKQSVSIYRSGKKSVVIPENRLVNYVLSQIMAVRDTLVTVFETDLYNWIISGVKGSLKM